MYARFMYSEELKDHQRIAISNLRYSDDRQGKNQTRDHEMFPRTRFKWFDETHTYIGNYLWNIIF